MSDEQRKRFEKWFTDTVLRRAPQPGQRFERDDVGGYIDPTVHDMWRGYVAGEQARDAEVQALREQVDHAKRIFQYAEVRSGYCVCGETLARHSHLADCSYTDRGQWESELWLKSAAALRGEEGTNDE